MKKLILSALLGMLFMNGCEKSISQTEELQLNPEKTSTETNRKDIQAFNLDDLAGPAICSPITAEILSTYFNENESTVFTESLKTNGSFTTQSGLRFAFSANLNKGGVQGVGSLDGEGEDAYHLRYNINSLAIAENNIIIQGVITKSKNFSDQFNVGNNVLFKLEDHEKQDRYSAAVYGFSPHLEPPFYDSQIWMNCGTECFPADYYIDIVDGTVGIEYDDFN